MLKVGLTGGIGSGKTLVSKIFKHLGVPVFNADQEAKKIVNADPEIIKTLKKRFGNSIYSDNGIDRKKLADIIFNDEKALKKVNQIIHPKVREYFNIWAKNNLHLPYVIEEAAILFESKANVDMDFTINVQANELIRIKRVVDRDNVSKDLVKSRMNNQMSDKERGSLADFTIDNDGDKMILAQVIKIHNKILKRIK